MIWFALAVLRSVALSLKMINCNWLFKWSRQLRTRPPDTKNSLETSFQWLPDIPAEYRVGIMQGEEFST